MMSKIIHPLVRTLRSRLGKDVRINCEGSTTDFTIEFLEMDIEMQCLEKA